MYENILMKRLKLAAHCTDHMSPMSVAELRALSITLDILSYLHDHYLGKAKFQILPRPTEVESENKAQYSVIKQTFHGI